MKLIYENCLNVKNWNEQKAKLTPQNQERDGWKWEIETTDIYVVVFLFQIF